MGPQSNEKLNEKTNLARNNSFGRSFSSFDFIVKENVMGIYTSFRCHVKIKAEYQNLIKEFMDLRIKPDPWKELANRHPSLIWLRLWADYDRANFIPSGDPESGPGFKSDHWPVTYIAGWWRFECALKNYQNNINMFVALILRNVAAEAETLQSWYEEFSEPKDLKFFLEN